MKNNYYLLFGLILFITKLQAQTTPCSISVSDNQKKFCSNDSLLIKSILNKSTIVANYSDSNKVLDLNDIFKTADAKSTYSYAISSGVFLDSDLGKILNDPILKLPIKEIPMMNGSVDLKIGNNPALTNVFITSGKLTFTIYTDLTQETSLELEFPSIKKDNKTLKIHLKIDANESANINTPIVKTIDLSNSLIDLASDGGKLKYIVRPNLIIKSKKTTAMEKVLLKTEVTDFRFSEGFTYNWYKDGSTTPYKTNASSIYVKEAGTYKIVAKSSGLCPEITDQIIVTKITLPSKSLKSSTDKSLCQGDTLTITSLEPTSYSYLWSDNTTKSNVFKATKSGDYFVNITNDICSVKSDVIKLVVNPKPTLKLNINKLDTTIVIGNKLTLKASGAKEYIWNNQSKLDSIVVKEAGKYSVTGKNEFGCSSSVNFELKLREKGAGLESLNTLQLSISPNPVSEILTVAVDNFKNNTLKIVDLKGNQILTQPLTDNKTEINVNSFAKGIYLVNISDNTNTVLNTKRFVVE